MFSNNFKSYEEKFKKLLIEKEKIEKEIKKITKSQDLLTLHNGNITFNKHFSIGKTLPPKILIKKIYHPKTGKVDDLVFINHDGSIIRKFKWWGQYNADGLYVYNKRFYDGFFIDLKRGYIYKIVEKELNYYDSGMEIDVTCYTSYVKELNIRFNDKRLWFER